MIMKEPQMEDAVHYVKQVKLELGDRNYKKFLDILKARRAKKIDTQSVIRRVSVLLGGNKKLLEDFSTFLPERYRRSELLTPHGLNTFQPQIRSDTIELPPSCDEGETAKRNDPVKDVATTYVRQVKVELGDSYREFVEILKAHQDAEIDTSHMIKRVSELLQNNKKLLLGFIPFLPDGYDIELPRS